MSRNKRSKRDDDPDDDDEADERMPYFVPEVGIDIEPLALYTRSILDQDADVKIGTHPQRPNEKGFWIISSVPVSREDIAAMIDDSRSWRKEGRKGHYVDSATAKRRLRSGRAEQGKSRPMATTHRSAGRETEDPRYARQAARASAEPDARYDPAAAISISAANLLTGRDRPTTMASPSPRPASAQPVDARRASAAAQYQPPIPGYVQATAQYTVQANIPQAQYASYSTDAAMYDTNTNQYQDSKRLGALRLDDSGGGGGGGSQPSTTGTHGFQSSTATSGGPTRPRAPANQGQQRRHG